METATHTIHNHPFRYSLSVLACIALLFAFGCGRAPQESVGRKVNEVSPASSEKPELARVRYAIEALRPLHTPMLPPQPGDWITTNDEPGQTFDEYFQSNPVTPQGARRMLYIQPLGEFTETQRRVVNLTADYLSRFYNLNVRVNSDLPVSLVPASERRTTPGVALANPRRPAPEHLQQLRTGYILLDILRPRLPEDAAALIAFTSYDLWPSEDMNYVFGQASLSKRVGVWSLARLGEPEATGDDFRLFLLRTLKIATHETGHMFSMRHCTKYECSMSGTNSLAETDRRPLDVCPECMAKVCWAMSYDPRERYQKLAAFCREQGWNEEQQFFEKSAQLVHPESANAARR
jgi:archaemetzincin